MKYKTAIITGASTGLGWELAKLLAQHGYHLGLLARRRELLEQLKNEVESSVPYLRVILESCDVTHIKETTQIIQTMVSNLGRLDLFIANAGLGGSTPAWKNTTSDVLQILQTNLIGAIASIEAAKEIMLTQGFGHLVGISSVAALRGLPASSAYCSSKAGLTTYLESIRCDLRSKNITVTSIHPGYIHTPMTSQNKNMPFVINASLAAQKIVMALQKKKARFVFPWPMNLFVRIMQWLPNSLYDFFIAIKYKNGVFK